MIPCTKHLLIFTEVFIGKWFFWCVYWQLMNLYSEELDCPWNENNNMLNLSQVDKEENFTWRLSPCCLAKELASRKKYLLSMCACIHDLSDILHLQECSELDPGSQGKPRNSWCVSFETECTCDCQNKLSADNHSLVYPYVRQAVRWGPFILGEINQWHSYIDVMLCIPSFPSNWPPPVDLQNWPGNYNWSHITI